MPFIQRRNGIICGTYAVLQPGYAEEFLNNDDSEVMAFLAPKPPIDQSDIDQLENQMKAILLCVAQVSGLSNAQIKAMFKNKMDYLSQQ